LLALALAARLGAPAWSLWFAAPVGLVFAMPNPNRTSLVEGCAGEAGYDELEDE
jgi:hypothetical protein